MQPTEVVPRMGTPEQQVADILPIEVDPGEAQRVLGEVPFWFHTFALNREHGIYTPGAAVDHRYRIPSLPEEFSGLSVLDVGAFDGFYAFVADAGGAERVLAIDNEQYVHWVKARWDIAVRGGEGFRAIAGLVDSIVEYRRADAFELDELEERFDLIYYFGILHRVGNPLDLLRRLRDRLNEGGVSLLRPMERRATAAPAKARFASPIPARSTPMTSSSSGSSAAAAFDASVAMQDSAPWRSSTCRSSTTTPESWARWPRRFDSALPIALKS
jgi:tRNA (mo5U34)-methyltransferase